MKTSYEIKAKILKLEAENRELNKFVETEFDLVNPTPCRNANWKIAKNQHWINALEWSLSTKSD